MPVIEVSFPEGKLGPEAQQKLVTDLTQILLKWEGLQDSPRALASTLIYLKEFKEGTFAVGGQLQTTADVGRYRVVVTSPVGTLDDRRKQGMVEEVTRAVLEAEGAPWNDLNRFRVQCLIQEIADGNWGGGGQILRLLDLAALLGVDQNSPRFKELVATVR
jgi:phenylpyruvate tautomerase PptA (4-oxalocrotonate tautomerase family)